jgi:hypothetical protein
MSLDLHGPRRRALLLGAAIAAALAGAACAKDETRALRADIAAKLAAEFDVEVRTVECPRTVERVPGAELECVAVVDGGERLPIAVTHQGGGELRWVPRGIIRLADVERLVEQQVAAGGGKAEVDCAGKVKASVPGSRFECAMRRADGTSDAMVVKVRGWDGTVHLEVR